MPNRRVRDAADRRLIDRRDLSSSREGVGLVSSALFHDTPSPTVPVANGRYRRITPSRGTRKSTIRPSRSLRPGSAGGCHFSFHASHASAPRTLPREQPFMRASVYSVIHRGNIQCLHIECQTHCLRCHSMLFHSFSSASMTASPVGGVMGHRHQPRHRPHPDAATLAGQSGIRTTGRD